MSKTWDCIRSLDRAREAAAEALQTEAANDHHRAAIREAVRHIDEADRIMTAYYAMKAVAELENVVDREEESP